MLLAVDSIKRKKYWKLFLHGLDELMEGLAPVISRGAVSAHQIYQEERKSACFAIPRNRFSRMARSLHST
jgi:hypothetical protein